MDAKRLLPVLALFVAVIACGDEPRQPISRSASKTAAKDLRKVADDPKAARADRVAAVFALFANHLKPPCGPAAARRVLGEAKWLTTANTYPIGTLLGWVPVKIGGDATVHCLHIFPVKEGWSDAVIYLRISGVPGQSADELRNFLRGGKGKGNLELVEFALCYPPGRNVNGLRRIERFGPKGLLVIRDDD